MPGRAEGASGEAVADGEGGGGGAGVDAELGEDVGDVVGDGVPADAEGGGDLLVGVALPRAGAAPRARAASSRRPGGGGRPAGARCRTSRCQRLGDGRSSGSARPASQAAANVCSSRPARVAASTRSIEELVPEMRRCQRCRPGPAPPRANGRPARRSPRARTIAANPPSVPGHAALVGELEREGEAFLAEPAARSRSPCSATRRGQARRGPWR